MTSCDVLRKKKATQAATVQVTLRLTEDEYRWLVDQTEETGATLQGYIRVLLRKARKAEASA